MSENNKNINKNNLFMEKGKLYDYTEAKGSYVNPKGNYLNIKEEVFKPVDDSEYEKILNSNRGPWIMDRPVFKDFEVKKNTSKQKSDDLNSFISHVYNNDLHSAFSLIKSKKRDLF